MLGTQNYFQVDEKTFIPIVNIGSSMRGIVKGKRPKEAYIRVTQAVLNDIERTDFKQKVFLDWLFKEILPSLDK